MTQEELELITNASVELVNSNIDRISGGIKTVAVEFQKRFDRITRKNIKDYLKTTAKKYFETKTIISPVEPIPLDSLYVSLKLKCNDKIFDGEVENILEANKPMIITGLAGCGKSTLLKHLFIDLIRKKKNIPLFIELRNIDYSAADFLTAIHEYLKKVNFNSEKDELEYLLKNGNIVIFFDGLDEVPPGEFDFISQGILDLRDKYYENMFIISSRPNESFRSWHNFMELNVENLNKDQAIELLIKTRYDEEIKERFIIVVRDSLFDKHQSFLSNPLLLTIMLITYSQFADIPEKLHLFYQQAYEALFHKHDATKSAFKRIRFTNIPIDEFQK